MNKKLRTKKKDMSVTSHQKLNKNSQVFINNIRWVIWY